MQDLTNYNTFIFDCDGVILDSNKLKISAMYCTLVELKFCDEEIDKCVNYFSNNFGKSRFHHVKQFIMEFLTVKLEDQVCVEKNILELYSEKCKLLYIKAEITPGFIDFISRLKGRKFVASGSEQNELREVFKIRKLDVLFDGVFGSPTAKNTIVKNILSTIPKATSLMFGDAISDLEAAKSNSIDFVAYLPYSNVVYELSEKAAVFGYKSINQWTEL